MENNVKLVEGLAQMYSIAYNSITQIFMDGQSRVWTDPIQQQNYPKKVEDLSILANKTRSNILERANKAAQSGVNVDDCVKNNLQKLSNSQELTQGLKDCVIKLSARLSSIRDLVSSELQKNDPVLKEKLDKIKNCASGENGLICTDSSTKNFVYAAAWSLQILQGLYRESIGNMLSTLPEFQTCLAEEEAKARLLINNLQTNSFSCISKKI